MPSVIESIQNWMQSRSAPSSPSTGYSPSDALVQEIESIPLVKKLIDTNMIVIPFRPDVVDQASDTDNSAEFLKLPGGKALNITSRNENPNLWSHSLVRGPTLYGDKRIEYAIQAYDTKDQVLINIARFGQDVAGHPNVVHGGLQAAFFDDSFGTMFAVAAKGDFTGVTANLNINYRSPMYAPATVAFVLWVEKIEGRKVFLKAEARSIPTEADTEATTDGDSPQEFKSIGEKWIGKGSVLFGEATALFIKVSKEQLEQKK
ncbi:hypothetical protein HDU77_008326 [Chytriomyces hyalinus]|nr:hypothetical protein HDU77_008326 [Chytriomyces hyalinus]